MKRRQSLRLLGLFPAWLAACKGKFPSAPTVVTGKVVDEDGLPVKDIKFTLEGNKRKGILDAYFPRGMCIRWRWGVLFIICYF